MRSGKINFKVAVIALLAMFAVSGLNSPAEAASAAKIDAKVDDALKRFYKEVAGGKKLAKKAKGILVFPSVFKVGIGIGGEYGEGALRIKRKTVDYYSTAAASIGFQLGAQSKSVIILFMTKKAYSNFRSSKGWKAGVDGSVALATLGAGGALDTNTLNQPIIGFIFGNKGLMYNLTIEGSKITKLNKK